MNLTDTLVLAGTLLLIAAPAEHALVRWLRTKTKNGNVQLLLTWADQAVTLLEKSDLAGTQKKQEAIDFVSQRLVANKLAGKFSQEQLSAVIEQAVAQLNATAIK
ncbi:phage holin, LLH family [Fructobacillus fructosus]|uniref:phage holin, LLH family n=1 Tax=Fructobacillus fructosus TaxID=1631 RepID=UPI00403344DF